MDTVPCCALFVTVSLAACAHAQQVQVATPSVASPAHMQPAEAPVASQIAPSAVPVMEAPLPTVNLTSGTWSGGPLSDPLAPAAVYFTADPAMSHVHVIAVAWRGGLRDAQVGALEAGRFISPCSEDIYRRELHHGPEAPVVAALACDGRAVAPDDADALLVVELVRERDALVVRTAPLRHGRPEHYTQVSRLPLPEGVPVTPAPEDFQRSQRERLIW